MKRLENESFEDYKARRKTENKTIKEKLKGTLIWQSLIEVNGKIEEARKLKTAAASLRPQRDFIGRNKPNDGFSFCRS